jgi:hypothetical protein
MYIGKTFLTRRPFLMHNHEKHQEIIYVLGSSRHSLGMAFGASSNPARLS